MEQSFFICNHCGNMIAFVHDSGSPIVCCGELMHEVIPGVIDASIEKHVPVYSVKVGSILHPMNEDHHIAWISLQTKLGNQRKELCPTGDPSISFAICNGDEVEAVYAYCNLHGLWVTDADLS